MEQRKVRMNMAIPTQDDANAVFIAHAREDIMYLLEEVDCLASNVEAAERLLLPVNELAKARGVVIDELRARLGGMQP